MPWDWTVLRRELNHGSSDLENMLNLPRSLRVWSGFQPKSLTIEDTELGGLMRRWGTLLTNLAALRWTISSWSTYFCWSQTEEQYSSLGRSRTLALYDFSFNCCGHLFRDRQRSPNKRFHASVSVRLALVTLPTNPSADSETIRQPTFSLLPELKVVLLNAHKLFYSAHTKRSWVRLNFFRTQPNQSWTRGTVSL